MQNLQLDLAVGQTVSVGDYKVTLVSATETAATFEIEGPGGYTVRQTTPVAGQTMTRQSTSIST